MSKFDKKFLAIFLVFGPTKYSICLFLISSTLFNEESFVKNAKPKSGNPDLKLLCLIVSII